MCHLHVPWRQEVESNGEEGPNTHGKVYSGLGVVLVGSGLVGIGQKSASCASLIDFPKSDS